MFQDLPDYFTLPDEKNKDLYDLYKNSIVGGPSLVFHRYHEKDRTFIRPAEYTDPKPCKLIYGVDANALYLWSIMQKMPTGHFVRRKKEDGFKRQAPAYAGQDRLYQRPRLRRCGDVGMLVASQYKKIPGIESFYRKSKMAM